MRYMLLLLFLLLSCKSIKNTITLPCETLDNKDSISIPDLECMYLNLDKSLVLVKKENINLPLSKKSKKHNKNTDIIVDIPIKKKSRGLIAYSVPNEMRIGKDYLVKVRISKENNETVLLVGDREIPISNNLAEVKVELITVSPIMSASLLSSNKDFEITILSTDIQNIDDDGYTEWVWNVTPLQDGENNLKLNVKIIIQEEGKDYYKDITIFERKIKVKSNLGFSFKDSMLKNWQWFISIIFIPLFQWLWLLFKKKKEEKDV